MPNERIRRLMIKFIDLFAGIGGFHLALSNLGCKCVFASEISESARRVYKLNFPNTFINRDITRFNPKYIPDFDILCGGFPCQPFSTNGKQLGFEDAHGTLIFNVLNILNIKQPQAFILENVANFVNINKGETFKHIIDMLEGIGYYVYYKTINSCNYVPQMRNRIYIVGFRKEVDFIFPERIDSYIIADILADDLETTIFNPKPLFNIYPNFPHSLIRRPDWCAGYGYNIIKENDIAYCLTKSNKMNVFYINGQFRYPTFNELKRLQGFPDSFKLVGSYSTVSSLFGNSVTVPVIQDIAKEVIKHVNI